MRKAQGRAYLWTLLGLSWFWVRLVRLARRLAFQAPRATHEKDVCEPLSQQEADGQMDWPGDPDLGQVAHRWGGSEAGHRPEGRI